MRRTVFFDVCPRFAGIAELKEETGSNPTATLTFVRSFDLTYPRAFIHGVRIFWDPDSTPIQTSAQPAR